MHAVDSLLEIIARSVVSECDSLSEQTKHRTGMGSLVEQPIHPIIHGMRRGIWTRVAIVSKKWESVACCEEM